jgi:hypothetical protein
MERAALAAREGAIALTAEKKTRLALVALQLATMLGFALPWSGAAGFPLDDAWIHQVVARTLATHGTLGYAPGAFGAGATSYAWAALLAVGQLVHAPPVGFTLALNGALSLVAAQLLFGMLAQKEESHAVALGSAALAFLGGNVIWFAFSGMEAMLFVALSLAVVALASSAEHMQNTRMRLACGSLAGLCALTRPDAMPLGAAAAAICFVTLRRPRALVEIVAPWSLCLALYFGANAALAGHAMPLTMQGRKWLWFDGSTATRYEMARDFVAFTMLRLRQQTFGSGSNLTFWLSAACVLAGGVRIVRLRNRTFAWCVAWTLAHFATFALMMPTPGHGGRYQPLVPIVWCAMVGLGAAEIARAAVSRLPAARVKTATRVATLAASAFFFVNLVIGWLDWRDAHRAAVAQINATEVGMARAIAELPHDARVASFDVGAIGYFSEHPVLDIGGLSDPHAAEFLRTRRTADLLRQERIPYLVLPLGEHPDDPDGANFGFRLAIFGNPLVSLEELKTIGYVDRDWYMRGFEFTFNAAAQQRLYHVTFPENVPTPRTRGKSGAATLVGFDELEEPAQRVLHYWVGLADESGLCARFFLKQPPADAPACFSVAIDDSVHITHSPDGFALAPEFADDLRQKCASYLEKKDFGGAVGVTLHALAAEMRKSDPTFLPPLPGLGKPIGKGELPRDPLRTAFWGLPLALALAAATWSIERRKNKIAA